MAAVRAVLGIDAAWTLTQPSGVALLVERRKRWQLVALASSYQRFQALWDCCLVPESRPSGSSPNASQIITAASGLCGQVVDLIAVDMPLAKSPISGRRFSDNAVSKAYGARKCGTHSPNVLRPGPISVTLREGFERAGFPLLTRAIEQPGVIEVYPHPALVELFGAQERLPYKAAKVARYWPDATPSQRRARLCGTWREIIARLEKEIDGVTSALPPLDPSASRAELKAYEDEIDAVICGWVAVCAMEGRANPFGDEDSAIWIPCS